MKSMHLIHEVTVKAKIYKAKKLSKFDPSSWCTPMCKLCLYQVSYSTAPSSFSLEICSSVTLGRVRYFEEVPLELILLTTLRALCTSVLFKSLIG